MKKIELKKLQKKFKEHPIFKDGVMKIEMPPFVPGLKRIFKKRKKLVDYLDLHPLNASNRKNEKTIFNRL